MHYLLPLGVDRSPSDQFEHEKGRSTAVKGWKWKDVQEPQAQAQKGDDPDQADTASLGRLGRGLDDADRPLEAAWPEESAQGLVRGELIEAGERPDDRIAGALDGERRGLQRAELVADKGRMEPKDVVPARLVVPASPSVIPLGRSDRW